MNKLRVALFIFISVIITSGLLFFLLIGWNIDLDEQDENIVDKGIVEPKVNKVVFYLYFPDKCFNHLETEERVFIKNDDAVEIGKNIVEELIKGPSKEKFIPPFPNNIFLKAFYITKEETAYVDLSDSVKTSGHYDASLELLAVYSIVNSLTLNIPEIKTVKILVDGNESLTLAGHIDLRFPFSANMLLIR
ncbi:MAG: GerMN domain-containing protein [Desulfobacterales bacterium]|nr:GerMN domain-containing protein [Desulfobacterales bacterium]